MIDCIIVGGGPAGLTAALYLARFLRRVTVFDAGQGRARMIAKTHNMPPFPGGISGRQLLARMRSHSELYSADIRGGTVVSVERRGEGFLVTTDDQTAAARTVILATGVVNHRPQLPLADHDRGLARGLIRYCPICDAHEVRGKRIAVLGCGTHGSDEASFLSHYSTEVTQIPTDGTPALAREDVGVLASPMAGLGLSESEVVVTQEDGEIRRFDTLYVALGTTARTDLAKTLGVGLSEGGCVVVDKHQRTDVAGIYAVGDVTDGLDQIAVAMGQGAVAATAIHNDLNR